MKHRISFYLTYACVVLFGTVGVLLLLFGSKAPRESESENRMLAGFPTFSAETVKDGSFMSGLESYLSDGMPARERIVTDTAVWLNAFSVSRGEQAETDLYQSVEAFGDESDGQTAQPTPAQTDAPEEAEITVPTETQAPAPTQPAETQPTDAVPTDAPTAAPIEAQVKACTFRQVREDGTYRTTYSFSEEHMQNAVDVLNAYRAVLPEDGHLFFTQVPYPTIAQSIRQGEYAHWESDVEATLAANTLPGVEIISALEVLEAPLKAGEELYFYTDHHWKARAACYVAQAMLQRIGIDAPDYDAYSYYQYSGFYGSLIAEHPELRATTEPDSIDVLIPTLPVRGVTIAWDGTEKPCAFMVTTRKSYLAYLDGTRGPWRRYETGVDCDRKCLVIGDSYVCCFLPYLAPYYEEIHNADFRTDYYDAQNRAWGVAEYIRDHGITDVYVVLSTASGINSAYMLKLMLRYL